MKLTQKLIQEEQKKVFALIQNAARLWYDSGEQHEALLFSQMKQVADDINKIYTDALSQVREETLKCPRHHEQLRCRGCQVELAEIEEENE